MRQPKTTSGHKRATDPDALVIKSDGRSGFVVRGAALDRLGVTLLTVHFGENIQGRLRIQELEVIHPEGVTGSLLRRLPLEHIEDQYSRTRRRSVGWYGDDATGPLADLKRDYAALAGATPRGSERFYRAVARAYLAQVSKGVRTPALAIADVTGERLPTVRGWVHRARLLGYLPPARRGAAG